MKTHGRHSHAIDAAALQQTLARRVGLTLPTKNERTRKQSVVTAHNCVGVSPSTSSASAVDAGSRCRTRGSFVVAEVCIADTLLEHQRLAASSTRQSQLAPGNRDSEYGTMSHFEWQHLEMGLQSRRDVSCPICMEAFSGGEVLLSCSHVFHRACLASFERLVKDKEKHSCPVCRARGYQKKITNHGLRAVEDACAVKLQALFRGWRSRRTYAVLLRCLYHGGGGSAATRHKYFTGELKTVAARLSAAAEEGTREAVSVLAVSDEALSRGRQLDDEFAAFLLGRREADTALIPCSESVPECAVVLTQETWDETLSLCLSRGFGDCAICMTVLGGFGRLQGSSLASHRRCSLLSCTHVFHDRCISRFELLLLGGSLHDNEESCPRCPVCRQGPYQKRMLSIDNRHFL